MCAPKLPREARAPIVPLAERNLAARVESNDVKQADVGACNAIRDARQLFEEVRREITNRRAELGCDLEDCRPVELTALLEQHMVDGELAEDLRAEQAAVLLANLGVVMVGERSVESLCPHLVRRANQFDVGDSVSPDVAHG